MFGPRIVTGENSSLVMKAVQPSDLEAIPETLHPSVTNYVSRETTRNLKDLFKKREASDEYWEWGAGRDLVIWGIFTKKNEVERLVGYSGFCGNAPNSKWPDGHTAESYSILFDPEYMGKGIAKATHACRSAFAFAMGVNCLRSSVIIGNERSTRAITGAGYALLGTNPDADGRNRYEFGQYDLRTGADAVERALRVARTLSVSLLDPAAVEESQQHVAGLLESMPTVVESAKSWMTQHGAQLEYLPSEIPIT